MFKPKEEEEKWKEKWGGYSIEWVSEGCKCNQHWGEMGDHCDAMCRGAQSWKWWYLHFTHLLTSLSAPERSCTVVLYKCWSWSWSCWMSWALGATTSNLPATTSMAPYMQNMKLKLMHQLAELSTELTIATIDSAAQKTARLSPGKPITRWPFNSSSNTELMMWVPRGKERMKKERRKERQLPLHLYSSSRRRGRRRRRRWLTRRTKLR